MVNESEQFNTHKARPVAETQGLPYPALVSSRKQLNVAQSALKWGTSAACLGVTLCLLGNAEIGGMILLLGLALAVFGLHRFGRAAH